MEEIKIATHKRPAICHWPIVRGVFGFIDSMTLGYKSLMRSAEIFIPEEEETVKEQDSDSNNTEDVNSDKSDEKKSNDAFMNILMIVSAVLGVALALFLFVWLPAQLYVWLSKIVPFMSEDNRYLKSVFEGVFKVLILVGYMAAISLMKDIRKTFQYHGAEHKTIFCYEMGLDLTVENVRKMRRFHPRCGTSFLVLMVLVGVLISFFIPPTLHVLIRVLIKLALIPVIMGIGYELIKFAGRHDNIVTKIISAPGVWLQHITVKEPDDGMIECAILAFNDVLPKEEKSDTIEEVTAES